MSSQTWEKARHRVSVEVVKRKQEVLRSSILSVEMNGTWYEKLWWTRHKTLPFTHHNFWLQTNYFKLRKLLRRPSKHIISDYHFKTEESIFQNHHFCLPFTKTFFGHSTCTLHFDPCRTLSLSLSHFLSLPLKLLAVHHTDCCTSNNLLNKSTNKQTEKDWVERRMKKTHVAFSTFGYSVQMCVWCTNGSMWQQ